MALVAFEERKESDVQTTDEGKKAVQMFYDIKSGKYEAEKINEFYNEMGSKGYDEWAKVVNFTEPQEIIKQVYDKEEEGGLELSNDSTMLDVGAGTGVIGKGLFEQGFYFMDALDASESFKQSLIDTGVYVDVYKMFLGCGVDKFPDELKKKYDCVTASGVFMPNHMPKEAMDDIHASLKTGGYFVTAMRGYLYENGEEQGFKDKMDDLVNQGKLKLVKTKRFMRGTSDGTGLYARMESVLVVLQRVD